MERRASRSDTAALNAGRVARRARFRGLGFSPRAKHDGHDGQGFEGLASLKIIN